MSMTMATPILIPAGATAASFTAAGGLVLTDAAGLALATVPASWVYASLAAKKLALVKLLSDAHQ